MNKKKLTVDRFGGINEHSDSFGEAIELVNLCVTRNGELKKRCAPRRVLSLRGEMPLTSWEGTLRGIECALFVTDGGFYKYLSGAEAAIYLRPCTASRATAFEFGEKVYILTDVDLYSFDGGIVERVEGYSPIIAISTVSSGECELYEAVNMLTPKRRQLFSTDGTSVILRLLEKDISEIIRVTYLGEVISPNDYVFNSADSTITLDILYPKAENCIEVEYSAKADSRSDILEYTRASVFGGGNDTRVFLYGSATNPSYRRHCEIGGGVARADYFPENNFTSLSGKVITSIVRHYDRQIIFCLDSTFYSVDELRQDSLGSYYHSFPIYALNSEKGHVGGNDVVLIKNEPISITYDGIYRLASTSVRDERNAIKISERVDGTVLRFLSRRDEHTIRLYDDDIREELWVCSGSEALIYNYGLDVWYFYDGIEFVTFSRCFDKLLLGGLTGEISVFEETDDQLPIRYVSGKSSLGDCTALKDVSCFTVSIGSDESAELEISIAGDGETLRFPIRILGAIKEQRVRLSLRRRKNIALSVEGSASELAIGSISLTFRERGRIF